MVGEHVGDVQPQLGVAVHGRLAAQVGAAQGASVDLDVGAALVGIHGDGAGAQDDVAGLVGLGEGGGQGEGEQAETEEGMHGEGSEGIEKGLGAA